MLSIVNPPISMSETAMDSLPAPEEILEDGEIDDEEEEEEVITEETFVTEEATESVVASSHADATVLQTEYDHSMRSSSLTRSESLVKDRDEDYESADEDKRRSHRKHQRKRKKHRDSKEKELRAIEKKERRRKRKMLANDDGSEPTHEHGGSASPHSRKRRKRKKHSRDRRDRDSTTPESNASDENYGATYYSGQNAGNGYDDKYSTQSSMYATTDQTSLQGESYNNNNNSGTYYTETGNQADYQDNKNYDSNSESGSDFESHLARYQNYKVHGEPDTDPSQESLKYKDKKRRKNDRSKKSAKMSSVEKETHSHTTEMYEEFMDFDENLMRPCKFYLEGNCLKGSDCTFSHDLTSNTQKLGRTQKRELCKYYLAGHCHHGDHCTYMHGEYPCKYFHTGATCYAGDKCRFSHQSTEETKEIIENLKDVLGGVDDSWEISELAKVGIKALDKPPPGLGLLPTPDMPPSDAANDLVSIPSLFDISVAPSADFQKRIDEKVTSRIRDIDTACILLQLSSVASLSMTDESEGGSEVNSNQQPQQPFPTYPTFPFPPPGLPMPLMQGNGLLPTPIAIPSLMMQNLTVDNAQKSQSSDEMYNFYEKEHYIGAADQPDTEAPSKTEKSDDDIIKTDDEFIRIDNSATDEENHQDAEIKAPDFLPATQKALFMRIHQKRTSSDSDKGSNKENIKNKEADSWTYSSDDEEKTPLPNAGIIKMDPDVPITTPETTQPSSASVESILKMIASKQGSSSANVDTNLLSKVASVINMTSTTASTTEHYNPASSVATYNPAQPTKASPSRSNSSTTHPHRERKSSGSSSASPGHSTKHHKPHPIRRRLSTQELTKEPTIIPLVAKQNGSNPVHSTHPDPRMTLSRLLGVKTTKYSAVLPRFSKDLILPGSGKLVGLKITLSSDESKTTTKRDPRLGRHKDPRLQRSSDPRLKARSIAKSTTSSATTEPKSSVPVKPSALLTKTSVAIPSLPELDLNLAHMSSSTKQNGDDRTSTTPSESTPTPSYSLPNLKLPKLMKAPAASPSRDVQPNASPARESNVPPPTIAPYDPRYMSSGPAKSTGTELSSAAPYDPRVVSGHSSLPSGMELKKRTIQLPRLTPAPSYKPAESDPEPMEIKPEGDQGDF